MSPGADGGGFGYGCEDGGGCVIYQQRASIKVSGLTA